MAHESASYIYANFGYIVHEKFTICNFCFVNMDDNLIIERNVFCTICNVNELKVDMAKELSKL